MQAGYRSSAAVLGVAFIQNIYGSAGMAPLMILGSVPLFNIFAVLILMLESPEQRGVPDPKQLLRGVATNPILLGIVFGTVYALLPFTLPSKSSAPRWRRRSSRPWALRRCSCPAR